MPHSNREAMETRSYDTPAREAAGLLFRIGFGLIVLVTPVAAVYSRRSFAVLVPIGALLILVSALVKNAAAFGQRARQMAGGIGGAVAILLVVWLVLSVIWTPFPASAAERAARTLANVALAVLVCAALPERMRATNLHLMSIGIALATIALTTTSLVTPFTHAQVSSSEAPTFGRAAVAVNLMVWPAVAWTFMRGRAWQALALILVSALATAVSGSLDAATALVPALGVFLLARVAPERTARVLAVGLAVCILLSPLGALAARALAGAAGLAPDHYVAELGLWADQFLKDPLRLLTGHGFDSTYRAQQAGLLNPNGPDGLLPMLWFDLGLPGAILLAWLVYLAANGMTALGPTLAPSGLAVLTAGTVFAFLDPTATQTWWQNVCIVAGMMLVAVDNGRYRTVRPAAEVRHDAPVGNSRPTIDPVRSTAG